MHIINKKINYVYRKYKPAFYASSEAPYPNAPHSVVIEVTVFFVAPAQIAVIRVVGDID